MRITTMICLLIICVRCGTTKSTLKNSGVLNGTWLPVKQEIGGKELPAVSFQSQKLIISDTTYTFIAESEDKGIIKYNGNQIDIYGKEGVNTGKYFTAIYKIKDEQLTICYNLKGDSYPVAFETTSKPGLFLSVFKKSELYTQEKK